MKKLLDFGISCLLGVAMLVSVAAPVSAQAQAPPAPTGPQTRPPVVTTPTQHGPVADPAIAKEPLRASAFFVSGEVVVKVVVVNASKIRVAITLNVKAKRRGTGQFYLTVCTRYLYAACNDLQQGHNFHYRKGSNHVRWQTTIQAQAPINSFATSVFDDLNGAAAASTNTILRT
jgi:hypothetical protein